MNQVLTTNLTTPSARHMYYGQIHISQVPEFLSFIENLGWRHERESTKVRRGINVDEYHIRYILERENPIAWATVCVDNLPQNKDKFTQMREEQSYINEDLEQSEYYERLYETARQ